MLNKTKQVLFYLWLLEIPDNGTKVNFLKFQDTYEYNYKNANVYAKNVLKVIKKKLDKYSNKSFNYSVKGNNIHIQPYYTKDIELDLKKETVDKSKINQKLHNWKIRHQLSKNDIDIIKSVLILILAVFFYLRLLISHLLKNVELNLLNLLILKEKDLLSYFKMK